MNSTDPPTPANRRILLRRIRFLLLAVVLGLVLSGVTAFPLRWELDLLAQIVGIPDAAIATDYPAGTASEWLTRVRNALRDTDTRYPFLAYGTDWLAFAHLVIALAFVGPIRDPVRNVWVTQWAILCCLAVLPLALIAGPIRGIPLAHQIVDCAFGILALPPLSLAWRYTRELERAGHPPA